jgi:hypothetical protein
MAANKKIADQRAADEAEAIALLRAAGLGRGEPGG